MELYRKGRLLIFSGFHRKPLMTLVKVLLGKIVWVWWECERENLSLDKLWEGEEICGCGHSWPEMLLL